MERAFTASTGTIRSTTKKKWYRQLYVWVLFGIAAGVLIGWLAPKAGIALEPVGTTFINAMKMLIGPIVFLTIVGGIASVADIKRVGVTGLKALGYFQIGTIVAMVFGLVAINLVRLGDGVNVDAAAIQTSESAAALIQQGEQREWWEFITHLVPTSMIEPFVEGDILQIIFIAVIFGIALNAVGRIGAPILDLIQRFTKVIFKILNYFMKLAPLGAFGAMAFAVGMYGVETLTSLGGLIALFYITSAAFIVIFLGGMMSLLKLNIFRMLGYLKDELVLIVGTSTAEPALPGLMRKMEFAGVKKETVGLVVPTGYSFNLDGAAIYLSLAALYIAQATNTNLTIGQQLGLLAVMLLTSKGAAGVAGGGFIALTATLSTLGTVPVAGIMLIFGIDKFMSECRAVVNFCGNAVATLVVARWEGTLDVERARRVFRGEIRLDEAASVDLDDPDSGESNGRSADSGAKAAAAELDKVTFPAAAASSPVSVDRSHEASTDRDPAFEERAGRDQGAGVPGAHRPGQVQREPHRRRSGGRDLRGFARRRRSRRADRSLATRRWGRRERGRGPQCRIRRNPDSR